MNFYSFGQYLKYRWKAKTRHGIHSPFVYRFADECLSLKGDLEQNIVSYFRDCTVITFNEDYRNWERIFNSFLNNTDKKTIILIQHIHKSLAHTVAWHNITGNEKVLLSIDLYRLGLLFFKKDFKEKQHFVLKYPL